MTFQDFDLIEHPDHIIGKVLSHMKSIGYFENTTGNFSSNNRWTVSVGANNGILHSGKQDSYEGGIKIPAYIY